MTSRIDQPPPILPASVTHRQAEETDTRQALQRHDPEFYKKKKDEGEEQGFKDPYEDLSDVSVPALKNFLLGLLDKLNPPSVAAATPSHEPVHEATRPAANPKAAAAMNAYQTGARRTAAGVTPPNTPVPAPETALDMAAANLDRAELLDLIRTLERLEADGVQSITLEKGESFLESIRSGIARVQSQ